MPIKGTGDAPTAGGITAFALECAEFAIGMRLELCAVALPHVTFALKYSTATKVALVSRLRPVIRHGSESLASILRQATKKSSLK